MKQDSSSVFTKLRNWILRGALFVMPIGLCAFLFGLVYHFSESWLGGITAELLRLILPSSWYAPWFPTAHIPGASLALALLLLALFGGIASWHIGRQGLRLIDHLFLSIPGVSTVYSSLRKIVDAIGEPGQSRFQKVVFIEWPGPGVRTIGFVTNEIAGTDGGKKRYLVYVPHVPNPTNGFVVLVDADCVVETNMTPDEGLKYCLSLGVLTPPTVRLDQI